jgi:hypothetical protein
MLPARFVLTALACLLAATRAGAAESTSPVAGTLVARLDDPRVNESSGIAPALANSGLFWTLNASGGGPYVFAFDQAGKTRARVEVAGAANFDWEDIASWRDKSGLAFLFVGDIGDNFQVRPEIIVYRLPEPRIGLEGKGVAESRSEPATALRAIYPDGRHNAESLLVHPVTGRIYVITKSSDGKCGMYALPALLDEKAPLTMERVAGLTLPPLSRQGKRPVDNCQSTGAAFSPQGTRLALSTYCSLYEWDLPEDKPLADALALKPRRIEPVLTPQMEAVCYDRDGDHLWFTSERSPAPLHRVKLR